MEKEEQVELPRSRESVPVNSHDQKPRSQVLDQLSNGKHLEN